MENGTSRSLVIHVGMRKTGSSAIQYALWSNSKSLYSESDISYPFKESSVAPWLTERGFLGGNVSTIYDIKESLKSNDITNTNSHVIQNLKTFVSDIVSSIDSRIIVLSREELSDLSLDEVFWLSLKELKSQLGIDIRVIAYFRSPFSYFFSLYKFEVLTTQTSLSFDEYLMRLESSHGYAFLSQLDIIKEFANCYNINFELYSLDTIKDSAKHFMETILNLRESEYVINPTKIINIGPSYAETFFCRGLALTNLELANSYGYERRDTKRFPDFPKEMKAKGEMYALQLSPQSVDILDSSIVKISSTLRNAGLKFTKSEFYYKEKVYEKLDQVYENHYNLLYRCGEIMGATTKHGYFDAVKKGRLSFF